MDRAGQRGGTEAGQENRAVPLGQDDQTTGLQPWQPRRDGKRALLVSERATVFDVPAAAARTAVDPVMAIADPIWDHKGGTMWTPDLVHCRLLLTGEVIRRLPPVLKRDYLSQLGTLALQEMKIGRRIAPSPKEISLADWTLDQIMARQRRQILLASAFGYSGDKIARALHDRGEKISGSTVQRHYLAERRCLAAIWQGRHVAVDELTMGRWHALFSRPEK